MINFLLYIFIGLFIVGCNSKDSKGTQQSIYDYSSDQILGSPIRINISEKENIIYKIQSDTLLDSIGNILLFGGVKIEVYNENQRQTNNIYSNKAMVYSKSDSMSASGDVKVESIINGYELFTDKIFLFNDTKLVRSKDEVLFINNEDSLRGIGFWSDFDMENWTIEKPIGTVSKEENE